MGHMGIRLAVQFVLLVGLARQSDAWLVRNLQPANQYGRLFGGSTERASIWSGTSGSWVNLHSFLPSGYSSSLAYGVWSDGTNTFVAGEAYNSSRQRQEAILWVVPEPATLIALGIGAIVLVRRRPSKQIAS